jgi:hypothetical protein
MSIRIVEEILRALNEVRGEDFQYRVDYADEDGEVLNVGLRGRGSFCMNDLLTITSICEKNGFVLDDFFIDVDEGELAVSLVIVPRQAR